MCWSQIFKFKLVLDALVTGIAAKCSCEAHLVVKIRISRLRRTDSLCWNLRDMKLSPKTVVHCWRSFWLHKVSKEKWSQNVARTRPSWCSSTAFTSAACETITVSHAHATGICQCLHVGVDICHTIVLLYFLAVKDCMRVVFSCKLCKNSSLKSVIHFLCFDSDYYHWTVVLLCSYHSMVAHKLYNKLFPKVAFMYCA